MSISSPNSMFDHVLESSHRDDSNNWTNIGFGEDLFCLFVLGFNVSLTLFQSYCDGIPA